jgi:hypothetical protein
MAGILDEIFAIRTNGNAYIEQGMDRTLLKRDLARLLAESTSRRCHARPQNTGSGPMNF